jgi:hypothetical protein
MSCSDKNLTCDLRFCNAPLAFHIALIDERILASLSAMPSMSGCLVEPLRSVHQLSAGCGKYFGQTAKARQLKLVMIKLPTFRVGPQTVTQRRQKQWQLKLRSGMILQF